MTETNTAPKNPPESPPESRPKNRPENQKAKPIDLKSFQTSPRDTGSSGLQAAKLSWKIQSLSLHFKEHKKDFHSRMGLLKMINRRKKLLAYLKKNNLESYQSIIQKLGLRK